MNRLLSLVVIFLCFFAAGVAIAQDLKEYDDYIRKNAPNENAFRAMTALANRYYMFNQFAPARDVYTTYGALFKQKAQFIENQKRLLTESMLTMAVPYEYVPYYDRFIREDAPQEIAFLGVKKLAERYINRKDWDSAAIIFKEYTPLFPERKKDFEKIIKLLKASMQGLSVKNLGAPLNSRATEFDPNPTPDGKYMYFTSSGRYGGVGGEDVWISARKDNTWDRPMCLNGLINSSHNNETIDNVSVDGQSLMLSGTFENSFGEFDIYKFDLNETGGNLNHYPFPINSKFHDESGCLTPDGKAILFISDRPGGVGEYVRFGTPWHGGGNGNMDIYAVFLTDSGYSDAINLGTTINTPYAERSVFLHPDGKTLYFSSDGHPGLGGLDVFKSTRLNDSSWTEWSEPINLGKEINSIGDDWGYKVSFDGDSAFFAGLNRDGGYGSWDIYSISLPDYAKPTKTVSISGRVISENGKPLGAKIKWEDLQTGATIGYLNSSSSDGSYFIALPEGKSYGYYAECEGFYPTSSSINLTKKDHPDKIKKDIVLNAIEDITAGKSAIKVNNIFFDYNSDALRNESLPELNRLVSFLYTHRNGKIEIYGYTDDIGNTQFNLELSQKRAEAVMNYLSGKGIDASRMKAIGKGKANPVASNTTEEGRQENRRVEVMLR